MQKQELLYKAPNHAANLNNMRLEEKWCDVTIKVNEREIRAHKVILAANLEYFATMLSNDSFQESKEGVINMECVRETDLEEFVSYAYTGEISLTDSNALNFLELANYLGEDGIKEACIEILQKHLKLEEACRAYVLANAINCPLLKNAAKAKIITNFGECSRRADYLNFEPASLMGILSDEEAHSFQLEKMLLDGIMRWIMHSADDRKNCLKDLLNAIDTTTLKDNDVIDCLYQNVVHYDDDYGITKDTIKYYKAKQIERKDQVKVLLAMKETASYQFYNFIDKKWTPPLQLPGFSNGCIYWPGAVLNDKFYSISKTSEEIYLQAFDPASKQITKLYPASNILGCAALCACNRFIYICGGLKQDHSSSDRVLRYDPQTNSFETLASMRTKREKAAAIFCQGYLYVLGGYDGLSYLRSVEQYDPVRNEWTAVASMFQKRRVHAVAELDGKLYVCGGHSGASFRPNVEVYDPTTNSWKLASNMNTARGYFFVVAHKDTLFAIGGGDEKEKTVEVYDPSKGRWRMDDEMSSSLEMAFYVGGLFSSDCIASA